MKTHLIKFLVGTILISGILTSCGPKISRETYVAVMSDMGCQMIGENTPQGEALLKEKAATEADITEFRQKTKAQVMMEVSTEIATKVAACHGVNLPKP